MPEERKLVSLVFADVVGSTAWTAGQDPEFVRRTMTRYFARMKNIAEVHGGTVEKFIGDAVMAVFGVPLAHEDDAERAVRTALAMRDALADLNRELGVAIALRIGVNSGEVATGGADEDRQFLVTGDAVNVGARLQTGAEPGEIVVGALTERLTRGFIEYEPRAPIIARGKPEPVTVYRAVRARSAIPQTEGGAPAPLGEMVGRTHELQQLLDSVDRATRERAGYLVTILGNAGVGKSRLVAEFSRLLVAQPHLRLLRGRCLAYGAGITYWPLMDVIREDAGIGASDDRGAVLAKLGARLTALFSGDRLAAVRARISLLLGLEPAAIALPDIPAERIATELGWGIRQYLEAIAARETLVIVIDDLQWADSAVLEVLEQVGVRSSTTPVVLVCIARPELRERHPTWAAGRSNASTLELEPLDPLQIRALLAALLGMTDVPQPVASLIAERSAGNPLFCQEFVRMLIEGNHLELVDGRWQVTRSLSDLPLPESIQAIVAARLDGLPPAEKIRLQRASVIGERFSLDHLVALDGNAPEALVEKGFLVVDREDPSGRSVRFSHLLIRDVAYGSLSKADRATLHDRVGALLEAEVVERRDEFSELIAYHAARSYVLSNELRLEPPTLGPRTVRALRCSALAGDRALALYATAQAATHYALAIEAALRERSDTELLERLYIGRGRALEIGGAYDDAVLAYEALERLAVERGDDRLRAVALARQATIYRTATPRFDAERAGEVVDAALEIARARNDRTLIAELQRDRIHIHLYRGHVERAIAAGQESLAAAAAVGSREEVMYSSNDIVCAYREAGMFEAARQAAIRATEIAEEIGNRPISANSRSTRATLEFMDGSYDTAKRLWDEANGIAESIGNFWGRSMSIGGSGWQRFERGDLGGAIEAWEESLRLANAVGFLMPTALHRGDLGWCYRTVGANERGDAHLEATHALVGSRFPFLRPWILGHLSRAATAHGTLDVAATYLAQAEEALPARTEWFAFQQAHVGLAAVELKLARRDHEGAVAEARVRGDAQRRLMRPYVADFEYLEGEALRLNGAPEAARRALSRARATASALGGRRILWQILASLAAAEGARGNAVSAADAREEARSIASGIADSLRPLGLAEGFLAQARARELIAADARPV
jgi:predicted ATPase/class 3 adenylate cyclase